MIIPIALGLFWVIWYATHRTTTVSRTKLALLAIATYVAAGIAAFLVLLLVGIIISRTSDSPDDYLFLIEIFKLVGLAADIYICNAVIRKATGRTNRLPPFDTKSASNQE